MNVKHVWPRTYEALSSELKEIKLQLAVDGLRTLQKRWNETLALEEQLDTQQRSVKDELSEAEQALDELQQILHDRGSKDASLNERYRRTSIVERLNSTAMVVREKRSNYLSEAERSG